MDKKQGLRSMGKMHAMRLQHGRRPGAANPAAAWRDPAARAATAGREGTIPLSLYPDCDRRSRDRTGSADLAAMPENRRCGKRSRTRSSDVPIQKSARDYTITAGEEFHLALRTYAVRHGREPRRQCSTAPASLPNRTICR